MKKISITAKPVRPATAPSLDAWVNNRHGAGERTKRLTFDIPLSLHQRVKSQCALRSVNMADKMRELLEREFPEEYQKARGGDGQSTD